MCIAAVSEVFEGLKIRQATNDSLKHISKTFSREQNVNINDRIKSLSAATFNMLSAATGLVTIPLSLTHRLFIVINKPAEEISFNEALELHKKDQTLSKIEKFMENKFYDPIKSLEDKSLDECKKNNGIKNRLQVSFLITAKEFAKPLMCTAHAINLFSFSAFHSIGSIFSVKCNANKGLYVVAAIKYLTASVAILLFMPAVIVGKIYQENCKQEPVSL